MQVAKAKPVKTPSKGAATAAGRKKKTAQDAAAAADAAAASLRAAAAASKPSVSRPPSEIDLQLLAAAETGNVDKLYQSLWANANVNCRRSVYGTQPLLVAVRAGNLTVARILLRFGASVTAADAYGVTALHWAAVKGRGELLLMLLDAAARQATAAPGNPQLKTLTSTGSGAAASPVLSALAALLKQQRRWSVADEEEQPPRIVRIDDDGAADVTASLDALPPAAVALGDGARPPTAPTRPLPTVFDLSPALVAQWSAALQALAAQDHFGNTPLHFASASNLEETCATLLQHGSNPLLTNHAGCKPSELTSSTSLRDLLRLQESQTQQREQLRITHVAPAATGATAKPAATKRAAGDGTRAAGDAAASRTRPTRPTDNSLVSAKQAKNADPARAGPAASGSGAKAAAGASSTAAPGATSSRSSEDAKLYLTEQFNAPDNKAAAARSGAAPASPALRASSPSRTSSKGGSNSGLAGPTPVSPMLRPSTSGANTAIASSTRLALPNASGDSREYIAASSSVNLTLAVGQGAPAAPSSPPSRPSVAGSAELRAS